MESVFQLSLTAAAELRRTTGDKVGKWCEEALESLRSNEARSFLHDKMSEIVHALVIPWMRRRNGLATKEEIVERLQRIAVDSRLVEPFFAFLDDLSADVGDFLEQPMTGVFCCDRWIAAEFKQVIACGYHYFVNVDAYYRVEELVSLVLRELSKSWLALTESFVVQAFSCCDHFHLRMDAFGKRIIRLS